MAGSGVFVGSGVSTAGGGVSLACVVMNICSVGGVSVLVLDEHAEIKRMNVRRMREGFLCFDMGAIVTKKRKTSL